MPPCQEFEPRTPDGTVPVIFKVTYPMPNPQQRRALAAGGIGDACSIFTGAEADLLGEAER
jgi:hypothetical protein